MFDAVAALTGLDDPHALNAKAVALDVLDVLFHQGVTAESAYAAYDDGDAGHAHARACLAAFAARLHPDDPALQQLVRTSGAWVEGFYHDRTADERQLTAAVLLTHGLRALPRVWTHEQLAVPRLMARLPVELWCAEEDPLEAAGMACVPDLLQGPHGRLRQSMPDRAVVVATRLLRHAECVRASPRGADPSLAFGRLVEGLTLLYFTLAAAEADRYADPATTGGHHARSIRDHLHRFSTHLCLWRLRWRQILMVPSSPART